MPPSTNDSDRPRTALVAGGGGFLGQAVIAELLDRGERVAVPYVVPAEAGRLREQHPQALADARLRLAECDVTDPASLAALLDTVVADWGPLWLAASVVGGWAGGPGLEDADNLDDIARMHHLNFVSAATVAREGLRHMGPAGGRVVLVGSRTALRPAAGQAAYSASKAAVVSLVATLAEELRGSGRTANAVLPGVIDTPANRAAMPDSDHGRWVPPQAIARVIAWLGSADSWPVSGAAVPVYGDS